jgi:hypothetical protein
MLVCKGAADERCVSQNKEQGRATQRKFCQDGIASVSMLTQRTVQRRRYVTSTIKSKGASS